MKRISILLIALFGLSFISFGQYKVQESSHTEAPKWVHAAQTGYLNTSGTGRTIEVAQNAAIEKVRDQVIKTIASIIDREASSYQKTNFSKAQAAGTSSTFQPSKVPFIAGISLSKVADSYWEKRFYKESGKYEYMYAVKYPFSDADIDRIVDEYRRSQMAQPQPVAPQENVAPVQETQPASSADPLNTVRNGLAAYFRFNGNTRSEISAIQGNPINAPQFVSGAQDGSQAISFSSLDESQVIFPKTLITFPLKSYSVTFWIKGLSDGHIWSCTDGVNNYYRNNLPQLVIKDGKFMLKENNDVHFNHQPLDYSWHFIALVVDDQSNTASLYIDGILTDSGSLGYSSRSANVVKFILGGKDGRGRAGAIDTSIDNLRIYGSRSLNEVEVAEIYMSER